MSNKQVKGGRLPLSTKETLDSSDFSHEDLDFNILKVDPELKAELEGQGLAYRWINAKNYSSSGNFHKSGWVAYRRKDEASRGSLDFNYGSSPEGYIIRNDLILAVKKQEAHARWKAKVRQKAEIMSGVNGQKANELREAVRGAGVKARVFEGYDEND